MDTLPDLTTGVLLLLGVPLLLEDALVGVDLVLWLVELLTLDPLMPPPMAFGSGRGKSSSSLRPVTSWNFL